jgi:hypothetical protein
MSLDLRKIHDSAQILLRNLIALSNIIFQSVVNVGNRHTKTFVVNNKPLKKQFFA